MARYTLGIRAAVATAAALAVVLPAAPAAADSMRQREWWLQTLHVAEAQRITTGTGVVVAVLDTGVQADHPDLAGQVLDGVRVTGEDDKGRVDHQNHGTGVAGLIAATGKGPTGGLGIAPGAKILPVTVYTNGFGGSDLAPAIRWAVDHGAKVINISQAYNQTLPEDEAAVRYALDHDVVIVASVGNVEQGNTQVASPASIPGVIAVSAIDRNGKFWSGSAKGPQVVLSAPGVDMAVLTRRTPTGAVGGYGLVPGGTSASAPIVAGAAALVRAKYPKLHAADVINRLIATADDAGPPGRDPEYGFGRLNLLRALQADVPPVAANPLGEPGATADAAPPAASRSMLPRRALVVLAVVAVVAVLMILLVVLVVVLLVRRGRRRPPTGPYGPAPVRGPDVRADR
ncbi:MAG TPA: type VII secretion-associated serine protease mycosin [Micromonosporaceae bacterium]